MKILCNSGTGLTISQIINNPEKCRLLAETDEDINVGDVLDIKGQTYRVWTINYALGYVNVEEVEFVEDEEIADEETGEYFICPFCHHEYEDADYELAEATEKEVTCQNCKSKLKYTKEYKVEYTVIPVEKAEVKSI